LRAAEGPVVWAHRPDGDLGALLRAARPVEAERAELLRAQFWTPGNGPCAAQWLAGTGLPEARALAWMLAGVPCDRGDAGAQQ
ncbi:type VI secretion system-associated protein TagF, partial [Rhodovulum sulfidophilum]|nr:type VI secretion system-associated protein TagF [Rhodovulum sulfidophilum]